MLDQYCNFSSLTLFPFQAILKDLSETQGTTRVVEMRGFGSSDRNKCLKMTGMIQKPEQTFTYLASDRRVRKLPMKHCLDLPKGEKT